MDPDLLPNCLWLYEEELSSIRHVLADAITTERGGQRLVCNPAILQGIGVWSVLLMKAATMI